MNAATPIMGNGEPRLHTGQTLGPADKLPRFILRDLEERQHRTAAALLAKKYPGTPLAATLALVAEGKPLPDALAETEEDEGPDPSLWEIMLGSGEAIAEVACASVSFCARNAPAIAWGCSAAFLVATAVLGTDSAARVTLLAAHATGLVGLGLLVFREADHG